MYDVNIIWALSLWSLTIDGLSKMSMLYVVDINDGMSVNYHYQVLVINLLWAVRYVAILSSFPSTFQMIMIVCQYFTMTKY